MLTITWVPLLLLSLVERIAWFGTVTVPFRSQRRSAGTIPATLPLLMIVELACTCECSVVSQFFERWWRTDRPAL
jgi:hypothetical protein